MATAPMFSDITLSDPDEQMMVTNNGKAPVEWLGFKRQYILEPNKPIWVPFHVICKYMGDPRSVKGQAVPFKTISGEKGVVPDRRAEMIRLSVFYGLYHNNLAQLPNKAPRVTVMTGSQRELTFPITNPEGVSYGYDTDQTQNIDVRTELDRVKAQLAELSARQEGLQSALVADDPESGEATEDSPLM